MGRFYGNLQVFAGADATAADAVFEAASAAVRRWVGSGPFTEAEPDDPWPPHRLVEFVRSPRWLTIFCAEANAVEAPQLARYLSSCVPAPVISCRVADSSFLTLLVFGGGHEIDRAEAIIDPPDPDARLEGTKAPHPQAWESLLSPGVEANDLERLWHAAAESADEVVLKLAALIGLDPRLLSSSDAGSIGNGRLMRLGFVATEHASWLAPSDAPPRFYLAQGLAAWAGIPLRGSASTGLMRRPLGQLVSAGGKGLGVRVELTSSSNEMPLLSNVRIRLDTGRSTSASELTPHPDAAGLEPVGSMTARFETYRIPRGAPDPRALLEAAATDTVSADVLRGLSTLPNVRGDIVGGGSRNLHVTVAPLQNPHGGVVWTLPLISADQ